MNLLLSLFLGISTFLPKSPVNWTFYSEKNAANEYKLVFTATIENGWNIYSQYLESDEGPVRTTFTFNDPANVELLGKNEESGDIKKAKDEMFDMVVIKIKNKGVFTQRIKVKDISKPITGTVEYMCCNEMQCLPPKSVPFSFNLTSAQ